MIPNSLTTGFPSYSPAASSQLPSLSVQYTVPVPFNSERFVDGVGQLRGASVYCGRAAPNRSSVRRPPRREIPRCRSIPAFSLVPVLVVVNRLRSVQVDSVPVQLVLGGLFLTIRRKDPPRS